MKIAMLVFAAIIFGFAFAVIVQGQGSSPCEASAPSPHIHIVEIDDNWQPSASCPKGWEVHISKEAADAYNKGSRSKASAVNLLADAPCIRAK